MTRPLMKCGCVALATNAKGKPICPIHAGLTLAAEQVDESPPSLTERMAQCTYCKSRRPSDFSLPFFARREGELDSFYCGCRGWD
jgi:hypothetical protein